jgi:lipopolysaccharide/colanic/teichoic acid biosynthesis glycosyltransferase
MRSDIGPAQSDVQSPRFARLERCLDIVLSLLILLVLLPLLLVIAVVIKLDSRGPVFFRQARLGRSMQPFTLLKFRTMYVGASPQLHKEYVAWLVEHAGEMPADTIKKMTKDPRVSRVGTILRKVSIDELPQLLNVLSGRMSLIGPRPALDYELQYYEPRHYERFTVRPGLSGLWQVSGRSAVGFGEMLDMDVEYVRTASIRTDLGILARTPMAAIRGQTA